MPYCPTWRNRPGVEADKEAKPPSAPVADGVANAPPAAPAANQPRGAASATRHVPDNATSGGGESAVEGVALKQGPRDHAVLNSAIEGYKAALAAFKNGRGGPDSVCDWSLRMLLAEDGQEWEVQRVAQIDPRQRPRKVRRVRTGRSASGGSACASAAHARAARNGRRLPERGPTGRRAGIQGLDRLSRGGCRTPLERGDNAAGGVSRRRQGDRQSAEANFGLRSGP